jgi:hypothetical protein
MGDHSADRTPMTIWRADAKPMVAMAAVVMAAEVVCCLLDGFSVARAIGWGLLSGPGWLAVLTVVAWIGRRLGWAR